VKHTKLHARSTLSRFCEYYTHVHATKNTNKAVYITVFNLKLGYARQSATVTDMFLEAVVS